MSQAKRLWSAETIMHGLVVIVCLFEIEGQPARLAQVFSAQDRRRIDFDLSLEIARMTRRVDRTIAWGLPS